MNAKRATQPEQFATLMDMIDRDRQEGTYALMAPVIDGLVLTTAIIR